MNLNLTDKTALVTGSTAGIGFAIAKALYAEGARVVVNGRTQKRVDDAVRRIREATSVSVPGGTVSGLALDLTAEVDVGALLASLPTVDILVNNLGIFESKPLSDVADSDWSHMFDVNVVSGARLSARYLPSMRRRDWGRIIFIASETGVNVPADMVPYGVSKAAQIALARGLAESTAGTGITVNSILPGPTLTEGVDQFLASLPLPKGQSREETQAGFLTTLRPTSLLKRFASPSEVASLVAYVASPLSSATNGAALRVEGGLLRGIL